LLLSENNFKEKMVATLVATVFLCLKIVATLVATIFMCLKMVATLVASHFVCLKNGCNIQNFAFFAISLR